MAVSAKFLFGSSDARVSFFRAQNINSYNVNFLIQGTVTSQEVLIENAVPKSEVARLSPEKLFSRCGDQYISSARFGGAVYALVTAASSSERQRKNLQATLRAKFGGFSASAEMAQQLEEALSETSYSIRYRQVGGPTNQGIPATSNLKGFFAWAKNVEQAIQVDPALIETSSRPYTTIGLPSVGRVSATRKSYLRRAASLYTEIKDFSDALGFVGLNENRFRHEELPDVLDVRSSALSMLSELEVLAADCRVDREDCRKEDLASIEERWGETQTPLPEENPLYSIFYFNSFSAPTIFMYTPPAKCRERFNRHSYLDLIELRETEAVYHYTCTKTKMCYDCGGGWDCQFQDNEYPFPSRVRVSFTVDVSGRLKLDEPVHEPAPGTPDGCADHIVNKVRVLDGALVSD